MHASLPPFALVLIKRIAQCCHTIADFDTQNAIKPSAFLVVIVRPVLSQPPHPDAALCHTPDGRVPGGHPVPHSLRFVVSLLPRSTIHGMHWTCDEAQRVDPSQSACPTSRFKRAVFRGGSADDSETAKRARRFKTPKIYPFDWYLRRFATPPPAPPSNGTLAARLTPDHDLHGRLSANLSETVYL
ncbi:hypothetical protein BKA70DRAFT_1438060 [Coprinopsis sp. MPI-PUGE-AT-0042]|nr:hypothetical protein BKA70DRAFT_1438060 [Coprinopsis sp. MPI-PUGE-AT-0042]